MTWIFYLSLLVAFELLADIFSKQFSLHPSPARWALAITSYVVANVFWLESMRNGSQLARGGVLFAVMSALLACLVGMGIYHEGLTWTRTVGAVLGLVAVIFLLWD